MLLLKHSAFFCRIREVGFNSLPKTRSLPMRSRASWNRYFLRIVACAVVLIPPAGLVWLRASTPENHTLRAAILAMTEGIVLVLLAAGLNLKPSPRRHY